MPLGLNYAPGTFQQATYHLLESGRDSSENCQFALVSLDDIYAKRTYQPSLIRWTVIKRYRVMLNLNMRTFQNHIDYIGPLTGLSPPKFRFERLTLYLDLNTQLTRVNSVRFLVHASFCRTWCQMLLACGTMEHETS